MQDGYSVIPFFSNDTPTAAIFKHFNGNMWQSDAISPPELTLLQTNLTGRYLIDYVKVIKRTPARHTHVNGMQPEPVALAQRLNTYLNEQAQVLPVEVAGHFNADGTFAGTVGK
jgi:hypothetical protein